MPEKAIERQFFKSNVSKRIFTWKYPCNALKLMKMVVEYLGCNFGFSATVLRAAARF